MVKRFSLILLATTLFAPSTVMVAAGDANNPLPAVVPTAQGAAAGDATAPATTESTALYNVVTHPLSTALIGAGATAYLTTQTDHGYAAAHSLVTNALALSKWSGKWTAGLGLTGATAYGIYTAAPHVHAKLSGGLLYNALCAKVAPLWQTAVAWASAANATPVAETVRTKAAATPGNVTDFIQRRRKPLGDMFIALGKVISGEDAAAPAAATTGTPAAGQPVV